MDKYAGKAIDLLVIGLPPKEVCEVRIYTIPFELLLSLLTKRTKNLRTSFFSQKLGLCSQAVFIEPQLEDSCVICEMVFAEIYANLRDNITVESIEDILERVCNYLPSGYVDKVCWSS